MGDFTSEDLFDAIDAAVRDVLARSGIEDPPVDAIHLAQHVFGLRVEYAEPDDDEPGRYGDRPKRRPTAGTVLLNHDQTDESCQAVAARAAAKLMLPGILTKLGVVPTTENRSAQTQLLSLVVPRLLMPTKWFATDARRANYDLAELKTRYPSAGWAAVAVRMLDVADDPCVVTVVEDGVVTTRRGNTFAPGRALTAAEERVKSLVDETNEPARGRTDGWTAWGWPTPGAPFRRIIMRAAPDEL